MNKTAADHPKTVTKLKGPRIKPKGRTVDPVARRDVQTLLKDRPIDRDLLVEYLHLIQDAYGHLSARHLAALAEHMHLAMAEVYETATFYAHFDVVKENDTPPPEITVRICDGIACEMAGAQQLMAQLGEISGNDVRIVPAPCVGACNHAPVAVVGKRQVFEADAAKVDDTVKRRHTGPEMPPFKDIDKYILGGGYEVLKECLNGARSREEVLKELEDSDLRGLGGAGFPTARKWRFFDGAPKPRIVAVNADEGEPGTFKDRYCFETDPHKVIEGALIACWAIEAEDLYIYLRDEYPAIHEILRVELARLEHSGLDHGVTIHLRRGAGAYVCGEETAMLESLEGKRGLPRNKPPFPAQSGLFGKPTLINNVETLYFVPEILSRGAKWFEDEGRPRFWSVSGRVNKPGVYLAPSGVTVNQLINDYAGGMQDGHTLKAYLPGGASGGILPADKADLPLDFDSLNEYGCFVGSAAVVILSDKDAIRDVVRNLMAFFEDESCGQCTPCRSGTEKVLKMMAGPDFDTALMDDLSQVMRDASICGLGQAAPNPVESAMKFFKDEFLKG